MLSIMMAQFCTHMDHNYNIAIRVEEVEVGIQRQFEVVACDVAIITRRNLWGTIYITPQALLSMQKRDRQCSVVLLLLC